MYPFTPFLYKTLEALQVLYNLKMGCQVSVNCLQNSQRKYKFSARLFHQSQKTLNNPQSTLSKSCKSDVSDLENCLDKSITFYQQFLEANPDLKYPFDGLGNIEDQVGYLETKVESWYEQSRESGLINGNPYDALSLCFSLKKDVSEGRIWYQQMINKYPTNQYLHFGLGNIYYKLEMYNESQKCYRKVIDINPRLDKAYQNIANIYCFKKIDNSQAQEWSKFALKVNPKNQYALLINAIVNDNVNYQIHLLEKLLQSHPKYTRVYNALGQAYMQKNKFKTAIKYFLEGYTKNTAYYAIPCGLALAHNKINKFDQAIVWSNKAIELNPLHHEPYHSLADALRGKRMPAEAKKWYLKCIQITPQLDEAYLKLARLYMEQDELQAINYFEVYLQRNPENSQVLFQLAKLYRKRKQACISVKYLLSIPNLQNQQESMFLLAELLEELKGDSESQYYLSMFIQNAQDKQEAVERVSQLLKESGKSKRISAILQRVHQQIKV